mgnify:CR=1 FL=1
MKKLKVVIVGAGKLAYQLFPALQQTNLIDFIQVISPRHSTSAGLAAKLECEVICSIEGINEAADLIFLATPDSEIKNVSEQLAGHKATIIHCSGSISLDEIEHYKKAVFYPLQTFTKDKKVDFSEVPFCIESSSSEIDHQLEELAKALTEKIFFIDSEQRKYIHLAAVFACNFSNLMYHISEDILTKKAIDPSILHNLISETANKIQLFPAKESQTGPAIRKDSKAIAIHQDILKEYPSSFATIYELLTKEIQEKNG